MTILVVVVRRKCADGGRLFAQSVRLGNGRMAAAIDEAVIAECRAIERVWRQSALIDKALTPSYVSNAARLCSMFVIPLQLPEKCRISPADGRRCGPPEVEDLTA
jgi:hypothetical protein